ncbi:selenide, water dikinase SelD [Marinobacter sp. X15-166B]|uniref:selenide, water dikinase SelD n=1 Tax=Marinobacter sp. X15-166B TaxID=1897620 RepID=UPI00085C836D|nr:selenide, water dikinase SelD [Marinobacter sp. X15-166B]OEY67600.1 selenide, water dikinase SelD [Marinobacter sp. X15-166B]
MNASQQPVLQDIVLIGGGHSHVGVLRYFAMNPVPGLRVTLICQDTHTPYSGMLPGYIAGYYAYDEVHIDLRHLAEYTGAAFYPAEVIGIDRQHRQVLCNGRPPVRYDLLSINTGATPRVSNIPGASRYGTAVKPIRGFNQRWLALLARIEAGARPVTIAVVGAGAGGVELCLAMQHRFRHRPVHFHLIDAANTVLATHNPRVQARFRKVLQDRGVSVHLNSAVVSVQDQRLRLSTGATLETDETFWVTGASGPDWVKATGLAVDGNGFIKVRPTLQTSTDPLVFAAGDVAHVSAHPREKAGVIAVRQARPLAQNLIRCARGQPPRPFRPQKTWLALISTGNQYAVASRGRFSLAGRALWVWKDRIDRKFMRQHAGFAPMNAPPAAPDTSNARSQEDAAQAIAATTMRCGGCGAKVGSPVLGRVLARLQPLARADVLVGLHSPDDAAVTTVPSGRALVHSVDFFRAFVDDPYVFGRIAANHSLGDLYAMGAEPQSASAIVTVPYGIERQTEETLFQMMAGAVEVLNLAGCALVGGHTGEGQELALGFSVHGLISPDAVLRKTGLQPGDALILTKPLGTGTLLAAHTQLAAKGRWIDHALNIMMQSNQQAAECLIRHGATACTDVTGFGLLGHLNEMTRASGVSVALSLGAVPLLEGAATTSGRGILSSLHPANARAQQAIQNPENWQHHPAYPLLFDPQTAGGLLAGIPYEQADRCLRELHALGYSCASLIGRVRAIGGVPESVHLSA